ncbi:hypothetical protein [Corynebacterium auriscanis]|uniref:hypothetical protein n=1 Tax=Corynebacterium auriscanis TaxID=99807 RepID=UPI003CEA2978
MTASSVNRDVTSICCASPGPAFRASGASRAGRSRRAVVAGAMTAGLILGGVMAPGTASAADQSLPAGSTLSDPLNNLAAMSGPSTDFLASITQFLHQLFPPILPGPFIGSTGMGSGESFLDWNVRR